MATLRQFGQELDQNVRRGPNLLVMQRDQIIGMLQSSATVKEVAHAYGCTNRCIRKIYQKYRQTGTTQDKPRSGQPPVLSLAQKKIIYRKVRAAPKIEYSELQHESIFVNLEGTLSKPPSHSTLYQELRRCGLTNHKAKKRPKINPGHAALHLKFSREYRHFRWRRRTLKFLDECLVQKDSSSNQEWFFQFPWKKWKPEMLDPTGTGRKPAQMV
jgi:transposase